MVVGGALGRPALARRHLPPALSGRSPREVAAPSCLPPRTFRALSEVLGRDNQPRRNFTRVGWCMRHFGATNGVAGAYSDTDPLDSDLIGSDIQADPQTGRVDFIWPPCAFGAPPPMPQGETASPGAIFARWVGACDTLVFPTASHTLIQKLTVGPHWFSEKGRLAVRSGGLRHGPATLRHLRCGTP